MGEGSGRSWQTAAITSWYESQARELPWRSDPEPWSVLVSEVMLQQTPVSRVLPVFSNWMKRWPTPPDLASDAPGEAVRAWGRLGYPRRALRLHGAAVMCTEQFDGRVPSDVADLRSLPGVGEYTAAAVASFAFGQRHAVLDTNVRRVHARWLDGTELPAGTSITSAERERALELLPVDGPAAARLSVSVMELGALVCTARTPRCDVCPLADVCAWRAAGQPAATARPRTQAWQGTDRQCRGQIMAALRTVDETADLGDVRKQWPDATQFDRALASLIEDGLVVPDGGRYRLP